MCGGYASVRETEIKRKRRRDRETDRQSARVRHRL